MYEDLTTASGWREMTAVTVLFSGVGIEGGWIEA